MAARGNLSDIVLSSYSTLLYNFEKQIHDLGNELKNKDKNITSDHGEKIKLKIQKLTSWIKETKAEENYIIKKKKYLDDFLKYSIRLKNVFSYTEGIRLKDLKEFDDLTLTLTLSSGSTPSILRGFTSTDPKFSYIQLHTGCMKRNGIRKFKPTDYCWDPTIGRSIQQGNRYLTTCSFSSLEQEMKDNPLSKMATGVYKLLMETTCQARYGNIWQQLLKYAFVTQIESSDIYYSNLPKCVPRTSNRIDATQTHSFQAILNLIEPYTYVPFRVKHGKAVINEQNKVDWPITLPVILSILVNGVVMELTGVLDDEAAKIYVTHMLTACQGSIVDYLLKWKSKFRKWTKLGILASKKLALLQWDNDKPGKIVFTTGENEIFLENEKNELEELINEYPQYYKGYVRKMLKNIAELPDNDVGGVYATLLLRHYLMTAHTISCGSNYNKTAPSLSLHDAYGTRINTMNKTAKPTSYTIIDGAKINCSYDWSHIDGIYKDVQDQITNIVRKFVKMESFNNLENTFVNFLTNRSGGVKYLEEQNLLPGVEMNQTIQKVSQTRIINFLLTALMFETLEGIRKLCEAFTLAGYREQIDRRMRVIAIVKNIMQLLSLIPLVVFNDVKGELDEIAMGKQIGNILDALNQIRASGRRTGFMTSSDVTGMDASVPKTIGKLLRHTIIDALDSMGVTVDKLFAFSGGKRKVFHEAEDGSTKESDDYISTLKLMTIYLEYLDGQTKIVAKDGYFTDTIVPSIQTFKSGEFFTSGNHTTLLYGITQVVIEKWKKHGISYSTLGDDFFLWMTDAKDEKEVLQFLNELKDAMAKFNLILELEGSRFYGDFLQQSALCGIYVPKPARSSIENVEKNDVVDRNPMDVMSNLINTSHVTMNRVYSQENLTPIIRSIWFLIRAKRYITDRGAEFNKIKTGYKGQLVTRFNESLVYLTLPFLLISVPPIGYPPILIIENVNEYQPLSPLTPGGDFMYNFWYTVFCKKEMRYELDSSTTKAKLTSIFLKNNINWEARDEFGITLSEHILRFDRTSMSKDFKKSLIGINNLIMLERAMLSHADQKKLIQSQKALIKLEMNQIYIPPGITYEGRERSKVLASFTTKLESLEERTFLDGKLVDHYLKYSQVPTVNLKKILFNTFYAPKFKRDDTAIELDLGETAAGVFSILPIIPACHRYSDLLKVAKRFGFPSASDMSVTKSISRLGEAVGFGFDAERAILVGLKVLKQNYGLLDTYISTLGLNTSEHQEFKNVVLRLSQEGFSQEYQSIFAFNKYFISNGDGLYYAGQLAHLFSLNVKSILPPTTLKLLARDHYFAYSKYCDECTLGLTCCYANWLTITSNNSAESR